MTAPERPGAISRRRLLAGSGLAATGLVAAACTTRAGAATAPPGGDSSAASVPFYGPHQAGIATPPPERLVFAAYDVTAGDAAGLRRLLATWATAAGYLTAGRSLPGADALDAPTPDTGEALGSGPSSLTITVGFGPSLFDDRFGLAGRTPPGLRPIPAFPGDALEPSLSGGDLCVQACADDPQVAFHAVHNLTRLALGSATLRYLQVGFARTAAAGAGTETPRNLLGFKDGTANLRTDDAAALDRFVWVGERAGAGWLAGGSYLVARRVRCHLEAWDRSTLEAQQDTIGRAKVSGAPLGARHEDAPVDLTARDASGTLVIPAGAHIRQAGPAANGGAQLLRRGYSFADGVDPVTGELDAGLYFVCFQRDPASQFVAIQRRLAANDALAQYLLHTGSGLFACPPGVSRPGEAFGEALFT